MLSLIARFLKVLNSESEPSQISLALGLSMISGFVPFFGPLGLGVMLIAFLIRTNLSAYFLGMAFFSGIAYLLDPLFHQIGAAMLSADALKGLWTVMYNNTIWRIQHFNNSIVMGGFVFSLLTLLPVVVLLNMFIRKYREHVLVWVKRTRLMQIIMASRFYKVYQTLS